MASTLTAQDLWPIVEKLSHEEQIRLAKLALRAAATSGAGYGGQPPAAEEFGAEDEPLAWDAEGWEQFGAPR